MEGSRIALIAVLVGVSVAALTLLYFNQVLSDEGWVKVPRKAYEFDQLPGEEVVVRGFLELNERTILAIPDSGEISLITEAQVDRIVDEGRRSEYDFREPGWTHVIRLEGQSVAPSYEADGASFYVILSTGTEVYQSKDVLEDFEGKEVEMIIKWDSFTSPDYPRIVVTQMRSRSIRLAE